MKTIKVVAAVIREDDKIFATARGYGEFKGMWEFPGVKIEVGEKPQQALVREIKEELKADIEVGELIDTIEYDYPTFHLSMDCFWAKVVAGELVLKEAEDAKWLNREELEGVDWLHADITLIDKIREELTYYDIVKNDKWDFDFEGQLTKSGVEQSFLSRKIFLKLFEIIYKDRFSCKMKKNDLIAIYIAENDNERSFLFDVMHNPKGLDKEGKIRRNQPYSNAKKFDKESEITFIDIYHTIGNFAPIPRTIVTRNYGPNLQNVHREFNELWLWLLKYMQDNWTEWPIKIHEIMSFKEYMKGTCQHLYYKEIFDEFYREHINLSEIDWEKNVKQWNKQIDDIDFAEKLVSFNYLFESNDFKEIDKQIRFLIEARGRCILSLLK